MKKTNKKKCAMKSVIDNAVDGDDNKMNNEEEESLSVFSPLEESSIFAQSQDIFSNLRNSNKHKTAMKHYENCFSPMSYNSNDYN